MVEYLDWLQWPAMIVTIVATWLVASLSRSQRIYGFWIFLFSNMLWIIWGLFAHAYALVFLQVALIAMNVRGVFKNDKS
ncbi:MAG TPA: hypothetical protein VLC91_00080 [Spongiibacteraceae bacterium]|nr:hypothetical protein [Spongiibacteraceae bacterium]